MKIGAIVVSTGLLTIVQAWTSHSLQSFMEVTPKVATIPDTLDMSPFEGITSRMIIGWNSITGCFPYDSWSCKANPA